MSLSGTIQNYIPNTLDGLNVIDADQIYIDGQLIDITNLVPYTGADKTIDLGAQIIKSSHTAITNPELVNKGLLDTTIANLSVAIQGSFLDKVTIVPQSVLGDVSFTSEVALSSQTASRVLILDASKNITSSAITTTTLGFLDVSSSIQNQLDSKASLAGGNSFTGSQNYADKTASTVAVFDPSTNLVSSAISTTELNHLGGTTSNIQIQLDGKLNLSGSNANQNISIGGFKVQSTASPTLNQDYTTKIYVDNEIIGAGSLYLLKTGGVMSGDITMGSNKVTSTATPATDDTLTRKGYVDDVVRTLPRKSDVRAGIAPNAQPGGTMSWYFGTHNNNDTFPYSDLLLLNGWVDYTAGKVNLISFSKGTLGGIRQFHGTYDSVTAFSDYYDCVMTDLNSTNVTLSGTLDMGANKVTSTANPTTDDSLTRKGYVDVENAAQDAVISALSLDVALKASILYVNSENAAQDLVIATKLPLSGGTITGDLVVNGATTLGTRLLGSPDGVGTGNFWIGLKGTGTEVQRLAMAIIGDQTVGEVTRVDIVKPFRLSNPTADRVLTVNESGVVVSSSVTPATLAFLDATSSVQTQLNSKLNLSGGDMTGSINFPIGQEISWGALKFSRILDDFQLRICTDDELTFNLQADSTTTGVVKMRLDSLGVRVIDNFVCDSNIGIGVTPLSKLHILSDGTHQVRFQTSHIDNHYLTAAHDLFALNANLSLTDIPNVGRGSASIVLQTPTAGGYIQFLTSSAVNTAPLERVRITGTGQVGIGTNDPSAKLQIDQGVGNDDNGLVITNSNYGSDQRILITMVNAGLGNFNSYGKIQGRTSGVAYPTPICLQTEGGNVGIGTTNPLCPLYNYEVGTSGWKSQSYFGNETTGVILGTFNNVAYLGGHNAALGAWTDLAIAPSANVGFGTSSPSNNKVDIHKEFRTGTHATGCALYVTKDAGDISNGIAEFRHSNGTQGIGIGYNGIYAAGSNPNQDLRFTAKGTGSCNILSNTGVVGNLIVSGASGITLNGAGTSVGVLTSRYYLSTRGDNQDDVPGDDIFGPWYGLGLSGIPGFINKPCLAGFYGCALRSGLGFMVLDENGKVGIGTTNAITALHIARSFTANGDYSGMISFENTAVGYFEWQLGPQVIDNQATFSLRGGSDGFGGLVNMLTVIGGGTGKFGMGTTNPTGVLHLYSATAGYNNSLVIQSNEGAGIMLDSSGGNDGRKYALISSKQGYGVGAGAFAVYDETAGAYRFSINSSGNTTIHNDLGIGVGPKAGVQLKLADSIQNRKIVLWDGGATNDHEFYGIGVNGGTLRFNVFGVNDGFSFFAGTSATTSTDPVRINGSGLIETGVTSNTTANLKLASSASHIDNNPGEVYLFTGFQGHVAIGRNTNRDASTANLCLGVTGTEESQIVSVNTDNSAYMPLSFASSTYFFGTGNVGIGLPTSGTYQAPLGRFTINTNYNGGDTGGFAINAFDGSPYSLRLFPYVQGGGQVAYMFKTYNQGTPYDSLAIAYNGNVGIGTNNPSAKLQIDQGFGNDNNGLVITNSNYGSDQRILITMVNAGLGNFYSYGKIQGRTSGVAEATPICLQTEGGNVGIGTTTPAAKLHVVGNTTTDGVMTINTSFPNRGWIHNAGGIRLESYIGDGHGWLGTFSNHPLSFYTNNSNQQMTLTTTGRLGIATTTPDAKLHVEGDTILNGEVSLTGVPTVGLSSGELVLTMDPLTPGRSVWSPLQFINIYESPQNAPNFGYGNWNGVQVFNVMNLANACNLLIQGYLTFYTDSIGQRFAYARLQHTPTGTFYYPEFTKLFNVTNSHEVVTINKFFYNMPAGSYDLLFFVGGNVFVDANDRAYISATVHT